MTTLGIRRLLNNAKRLNHRIVVVHSGGSRTPLDKFEWKWTHIIGEGGLGPKVHMIATKAVTEIIAIPKKEE